MSTEREVSQAVDLALDFAGSYEKGHTILNSGLHSDMKIIADRLVDYPEGLSVVRYHLEQATLREGIQGSSDQILSVPTGMSSILSGWDRESSTIYPEKIGIRSFRFTEQQRQLIRNAGRIAIVDDVLTTGGTPAAMAEQVRQINEDAELCLIGIVLRGEVLAVLAKHFVSQRFLLFKPISSWRSENCPHPACQV